MRNCLLKSFMVFLGVWLLHTFGSDVKAATQATNKVAEDSKVLYGYMVTDTGSSVVALDLESGEVLDTKAELIYAPVGGYYLQGVFTAGYNRMNMGTFSPFITSYSTKNWEELSTSMGSSIWAGVYDKASDNVYWYHGLSNRLIYSTNPETLANTLQIPIVGVNIVALVSSNDGILYAISNYGILYKLDKISGETEEIGSLEINLLSSPSYCMGAVFGADNDSFYFAAQLSNQTTALYKVNIETGKATLVYEFPNNEIYVSLFYDDEQILDNAPAAATGLFYEPVSSGSLVGTLSFNLPDKTYGGEDLSGSISAEIYMNSTLVKELTDLTPGREVVVEDIVAPGSGSTKVRIILSNQAGNGATSRSTIWVGYDQPKSVENVTVTLDEDTEKPFITWVAPEPSGVNGGYIDISELTYEIRRYTDSNVFEVIESAWEETEFLDQSFEVGEMAVYSYGIVPILADLSGTVEISKDRIVLGGPHSIPFSWGMSDMSSFNFELITTLDLNGDGYTWGRSAQGMDTSTYASQNDDWAYTPPISIENPGTYDLSFLLNFHEPSSTPEKTNYLKVVVSKGTAPTADDIIVDELEVVNNTMAGSTISNRVTITEPGIYYIGFYSGGSYNYNNNTAIRINDVKLDLLAGEGIPAEATGVKLTAPQKGGLAPVKIQFVLPEVDAANKPLTSIVGYKIYRNGSNEPITVVRDVEDPATLQPGETVTVWDNEEIGGFITYTVVIYNENGDGLSIEETLFVGPDVPEAVSGLKVTKTESGEAKITWSNSKGINGAYVDVAGLRFRIERNEGGNSEELISDYAVSPENMEEATDENGNIYIVYNAEYIDTNIQGEGQHVYTYTIIPYYDDTQTGASATTNPVRFGAAYPFPFAESFAGASYDNSGWFTEVIEGEGPITAWKIEESYTNYPQFDPQDEDGGMAVYYANNAGNSIVRLMSPEISTENMQAPSLIFWYNHTSSNNRGIDISIAVDGNEEFEVIREIPAYFNNITGWYKHEIDLTPYKDHQTIMIGFDGYERSGSTWGNNMAIDNISIINRVDMDLEVVSVTTPVKLVAGGMANEFEIVVWNQGGYPTDDFVIEWYGDDNLIGTSDGEEIKALESGTIKSIIKLPLEYAGQELEFYAVIKVEGDATPDNNTSEVITIQVMPSVYPVVSGLDGNASEEKISLTWDENEAIQTPVIVQSEILPTNYVFYEDPLGYNDIEWGLYTSPELPGVAQTITLYAKYAWMSGGNKLQFFTSNTDDKFESFVAMGDSVEIGYETVEIVYDLPEGTKYFQARVGLYYRDISIPQTFFMKAAEAGDDGEKAIVNVTGYNVYRDGVKIGTSTTASYEDEDPNEGNNTYKVTAVYGEDHESEYSEEKVINFVITGIDGIEVAISVYTAEGSIIIEGAEQLPIAVTNIQGALIARQNGTGNNVISVSTGVYLVQVGDKVVKVNVK